MNMTEQIILALSIVVLIFSSISVFALKKPLRLWSFSALAAGVPLYIYYPEQKILAVSMIFVAVLYFLKGMRIFAYRKTNVLTDRRDKPSILGDAIVRLKKMTMRKWIACIISLSAAVYFVMIFFPFRMYMQNVPEDLMYTAFVVLIIYYVRELLNVILLNIIAPLFVIKEETRTARLKDALLLEKNIGKGIFVAEPYLFFEKNEYYVSYRRYSSQIGEIAGCLCEYTVYTDIFGGEFIKDCPVAVSGNREFTQIVASEDLKKGLEYYVMGRRLSYENHEKGSIVPILLGFILPVVLISFTMLLLYFFQNQRF